MGQSVPFGSHIYLAMLAALAFSRGMDFLSTWVGTPNLALEANPIARLMGWKIGLPVNLVLVFVLALWPLPAVVISTASLLVAARNFQFAWLMRSLGEHAYRAWFVDRVIGTPLGLFLFCLAGNTLLTASVGAALLYFGGPWLIPAGIGMGIIAYAFAVAFYSLLSLFRIRRANRRISKSITAASEQTPDEDSKSLEPPFLPPDSPA